MSNKKREWKAKQRSGQVISYLDRAVSTPAPMTTWVSFGSTSEIVSIVREWRASSVQANGVGLGSWSWTQVGSPFPGGTVYTDYALMSLFRDRLISDPIVMIQDYTFYKIMSLPAGWDNEQ